MLMFPKAQLVAIGIAAAGGSLQVQQQCDKVIDDFAQGLKLTRVERHAGVKSLLEKCMKAQVAAQSAAAPAATTAGVSPQQPVVRSAGTSDETSYGDTVKWIQEEIQQAGVPGPDKQSQVGETFLCTNHNDKGECTEGHLDAQGLKVTESISRIRYAVSFDARQDMDIVETQSSRSARNDANSGDPNNGSLWMTTTTHLEIPFSCVEIVRKPEKVKAPDLADHSRPLGSPPSVVAESGLVWSVSLVIKDGAAA